MARIREPIEYGIRDCDRGGGGCSRTHKDQSQTTPQLHPLPFSVGALEIAAIRIADV